jgi:large subunit ribosomal protein L10
VTLKLEDKKAIVAEVADVASKAISAVAVDYRGLTVNQLDQLRAQARNSGVYLRVVRNTLARRAVAGSSFDCMQSILVGPLMLAFSKEDPGAAARLLKVFVKANPKCSVVALAMDGKLMKANQLDAVASLPTRDEAIAQLMAVMKAPITKFVRTLAEPHAKFVRTLAAVGDQKKSS